MSEDPTRGDQPVEQPSPGSGSARDVTVRSESTRPPLAIDPWAEAVAEVMRLAVGLRRPESPGYPVIVNNQVQFFLERFTRDQRDIVNRWLSRSGRYMGMIREVLKSRGLPEDLAFTAMIESGFNPVAVSRAGAVGLWQFMAATARRYGLRVDSWVDERLDPEKSTLAAASYLRDLYQQFGSWFLAQAAYNAGEVNVSRAIQATGSTDFWVLARSRWLKQETKEYVPQIQAATMIGRDPLQYGFESSETVAMPFEKVSVPPATDLRRLAVLAGVPMETLRALNPTLVRGVTPPGSVYALRVPAGRVSEVQTAVDSAKQIVTREQTAVRASRGSEVHVVRPRDTVTSIARRYGVSVGDLMRWNSLERHVPIRPGDRLRLTATQTASGVR
jgi:peptidoglycan lytic transglycosylase D